MRGPSVVLSTAALFARPLAATFALAAECGYTGVEVMVTKDPASQDPAEMRRLADAQGLRIGAIHAPALLLTRSVWGTDPIGKIDMATRVAKAAEIPLVVMHPPYRWQQGYRRWLRESLATVEDRTGVTVAIENMFPVHIGSKPLMLHANQDLDQLAGFPHLVLDTRTPPSPGTIWSRFAASSGTGCATSTSPTTRARGGTRTSRPARACSTWTRSCSISRGSDFTGAVSLEVDLRKHTQDRDALCSLLTSMRERVEATLASG